MKNNYFDYTLSVKPESISSYSIWASGVTQTTTTLSGFIPGVTYSILVQARNKVGYSTLSESILVLAA